MTAGLTGSEQGRVAFDYARLTPAGPSADHHDADGQKTVAEAVDYGFADEGVFAKTTKEEAISGNGHNRFSVPAPPPGAAGAGAALKGPGRVLRSRTRASRRVESARLVQET